MVNRILSFVGWLAMLLVMAALGIRFGRPAWEQYAYYLAWAGLVCALAYTLGQWREIAKVFSRRQARYGTLIVAFSASRMLWLSDILLFFTGAALMIVFSTVTSLIQLIAPNEMRGRVMSIYMLAFRGGMPLGSLVSGYLATLIGAPTVIIINGALLVLVAIYFLLRSHGVREA